MHINIFIYMICVHEFANVCICICALLNLHIVSSPPISDDTGLSLHNPLQVSCLLGRPLGYPRQSRCLLSLCSPGLVYMLL